MGKLDNKVVIITGSGGGIGRETAIRFATEGASLSLCDMIEDGLLETKELCESKGAAVFSLCCDVTNPEQLEQLVTGTIDTFGKIDVLLNNAINAKPGKPFMELTEEDLMTVFESGYLATWRLMQLCFPYLKEHGGKIINFASASGIKGTEGYAGYASVKEAIRGLTKVVAREWGKYGINVNCIAPTAITPKMEAIIESFPEGQRVPQSLGYTIPALGRIGRAYDDVTPVLVFMASDDSSYITGQTIRADGGGTIF